MTVAAVASLTTSAAATLPAGQTFNPTGGEQTYTVPAGVTAVHVELVGGKGAGGASALAGAGNGGAGGLGADVRADLSVSPAQTLYVEVGQNGGTSSAAYGGGGAPGGTTGGGGGGASDVRTCSINASSCVGAADTLASRLLIAAGGGGGGAGYGFVDTSGATTSCTLASPCPGGAGGPAGQNPNGDGQTGSNGTGGNSATNGGGPGTSTSGGPAGAAPHRGSDGALGAGGAGGNSSGGADGGGGGGGLYGGGGGGAINGNDAGTYYSGGAGGGGGSSFVASSATNGSVAADTGGSPQITITPIAGAPQATTGGASASSTSATISGTTAPNGLPTVYYAEYGLDNTYGVRSASTLLGAQDTAGHAVAVKLAGLAPGTLFHYRIVATNSAGTAYGSDQTFRTSPALVAGIAVAKIRTIPPRAIVPIFTNMSGTARLTATPVHRRVKYGHGRKVRCGVRHASKNLAPHNGGVVVSALVGGCSYHLQLTMSSDGQTASDNAMLQVFRVRKPKRHR